MQAAWRRQREISVCQPGGKATLPSGSMSDARIPTLAGRRRRPSFQGAFGSRRESGRLFVVKTTVPDCGGNFKLSTSTGLVWGPGTGLGSRSYACAMELSLREEAARAWLQTGTPAPAKYAIRFSDDLKRSAIVAPKGGAEEHWQYLYDCWPMRVTQPLPSTGPDRCGELDWLLLSAVT